MDLDFFGSSIVWMQIELPFNFTNGSHQFEDIIADYLKKEQIFDSITQIVLICIYTLLIVFGILLNTVIISVIVWSKKLRTSNNILLLNLFVSNLLLCIFCMPFTLIAIIRRSWAYGVLLCKLVPFIQAVTTFVSSTTLLSIALDRMLQITANQLRGSQSSILSKYGYITLIIWIISLLLAFPICIYQRVAQFGIKGLVSINKCIEMLPNFNRGIYSVVILITQLLVPSLVMFFSYFRIRKHLNSNSFHNIIRVRQRITDSPDLINSETIEMEVLPIISSTTNTWTSAASSNSNQQNLRKQLNRNNRITIFLIEITLIFFITWLPLNLFNVMVDFYPELDLYANDFNLLFAVFHMIAMSSSVTYAIFYGFHHTVIKSELIRAYQTIKSYF